MLPRDLGLILRAALGSKVAARRLFLRLHPVVLRASIGFVLLHERTVLGHAASEAVLEGALMRQRLHHHSFGVCEVYLTFIWCLIGGSRFLHLSQILWTGL